MSDGHLLCKFSEILKNLLLDKIEWDKVYLISLPPTSLHRAIKASIGLFGLVEKKLSLEPLD